MSCCVSSPCGISLQKRAIHEIAKLFWEKFVLRELRNDEGISYSAKIKSLVRQRDTFLNDLPNILCAFSVQLSSSLPELLKSEMINAVYSLQQGYYEALVWEEKYCSSLPSTVLNPVTAGIYQASNFIEASGHFNDFAWVKLFVTDENMDVKCRFKMSCFYCLDDVVTNLWNNIECEKRDPFVISTHYSGSKVVALDNSIFFWALKVANHFGEPGEALDRKLNELNEYNLYQAISSRHEYAARYFLSLFSDSRIENFLINLEFDLIYFAARRNLSEVVHILYILLSKEHKNTLVFLENSLFKKDMGKVWSCLLNSQFHKCIVKDILTFPESIPDSVYADIFRSLISNIKEFNYPIQKRIFKILWKHVSRKKLILKLNCFTISTFIKVKEMDLIQVIITPLSYPVKYWMIELDLEGAGKTALYELSNINDYGTILRYLIFFLIDKDSSAKMSYSRVYANSMLENLKKDVELNWSGFDEIAKQRISRIIDNINESLILLDDILNEL